MIGRPDPAVPAGTLWLTGFDRSNLGPELAKHGAHLVNDPHPTQNFFQRSDNYALALQGIVAQSVSSFGLHKDYHQPSDELSTIDFTHMTNAIASMINPIRWLANTNWKPAVEPRRQTRCHSATKLDLRKHKRAAHRWTALSFRLRSREVEAIEVHHLVPGRHKVTHEDLLRVAARIHFGERSELRVRPEDEIDNGARPLRIAGGPIESLQHAF